jgi:ubiquinone/menaquinone biosynthesis C-methylase UbiE
MQKFVELKSKSKSKSIREQYEKLGVKQYYQNNSDTYSNPHFPIIEKSFDNIFGMIYCQLQKKTKINILDFACGDGIITNLILRFIQNNNCQNIEIDGCDPYLSQQYLKNNHNNIFVSNCYTFSYEDILKNDLFNNNMKQYYDIIIISFAIHLLDKKCEKFFLDKISYHTKYLLIISPTKNKGDFENISFIKIHEEKFNEKISEKLSEKKVFYNLYMSTAL